VKQLLPCFLSHLWVDCKEAADGADGRAECGKRRTSWGPSRYRYRKSATAVRRVTDVPTVLPSSIFDFVLGTSPSWSPKVCVLHGHTPYGHLPPRFVPRVVRAEWAWIPTSRAAATDALVVC